MRFANMCYTPMSESGSSAAIFFSPVQFYGTNDQVTLAFAMVVDNLAQYDPTGSETIERLRARWEQRRVAESFAPPDVDVGGEGGSRGAPYGGRSDSRGGYGGNDRYEPYPRSGGRRSGGRYDYDSRRGSYGGDLRGAGAVPAGVPSAGPVVVMQGGQAYPQGMAGPMPTVLMQQPDGSLLQVQVMSHAGGHYAVQPATQLVRSSHCVLAWCDLSCAHAVGGLCYFCRSSATNFGGGKRSHGTSWTRKYSLLKVQNFPSSCICSGPGHDLCVPGGGCVPASLNGPLCLLCSVTP
jgi:hypothetical protein